MRTLLILGLVVLAAAAAGPAGAATVKPLPVPAGAIYLGSDGVDRIAYESGPYGQQRIGVRDLKTGKAVSFAPPSPGCSLIASTGGISASCGLVGSTAFALFVRGYEADDDWTAVPAPFMPYDSIDSVEITGVGRRWLAVQVSGYHWTSARLLPRAGGNVSLSRTADGARWVPNLDAVNPERVLCRPLTRSAQGSAVSEARSNWAPIAYAKPWALDGPAFVPAIDGAPITIRLRHCGGSPKPSTLCTAGSSADYAVDGCTAPSLTTRQAAWSKGPVGYVRDLRTGRTTAVRISDQSVQLHLVGSHVVAIGVDGNSQSATIGVLRR